MPTSLKLLTSAAVAFTLIQATGRAEQRKTRSQPLKGKSLDAFRRPLGNWEMVGSVSTDADNVLAVIPKPGHGVATNAKGKTNHLITREEFGDVQIHIEFMIPKATNSGVYVHGRYEIQIINSWGRQPAKWDCGAIYERWAGDYRTGHGYEGRPPRVNASRQPGEWQAYDITFRAPRFDDHGKKTANAMFVKVVHNGIVIHENEEVSGPTREAPFKDEQATGPLVLQGDHGIIAYRNITLTPPGHADAFDNGDFDDFTARPDVDGKHIEVHHGGIIFSGNKYWWYGQTFRDVPKGKDVWPVTKKGVEMYSSEDLLRWEYEGVVLPCQPSGDLEGPMRFERVKILYNERTQRYAMWFHYIGKDPLDRDVVQIGRADAGVASCDRINGVYQWHGYQRPLGPKMTVKDCTLFKDEDGKGYFIFDSYPAGRSTTRCIHIARLSDDYLRTTEVRKIPNAQRREAPVMIKNNGYYFLLTSGVTGFHANAARCHRAKNIFGPYEDLGNFCRGPRREITFNSQGTHAFELNDRPGSFVFMADRWNRQDDMRRSVHVWLPLEFPTDDTLEMHYHRRWGHTNRKK